MELVRNAGDCIRHNGLILSHRDLPHGSAFAVITGQKPRLTREYKNTANHSPTQINSNLARLRGFLSSSFLLSSGFPWSAFCRTPSSFTPLFNTAFSESSCCSGFSVGIVVDRGKSSSEAILITLRSRQTGIGGSFVRSIIESTR
jgi:hypothetical protein